EMDGEEGGEEDGRPEPEGIAELRRRAHDQPRLDQPQLGEGEEGERDLALGPGSSGGAPRVEPLAQAGQAAVRLDRRGGDAQALDLADVGEGALVRPLPDLLR